jgi:hypothetical protein
MTFMQLKDLKLTKIYWNNGNANRIYGLIFKFTDGTLSPPKSAYTGTSAQPNQSKDLPPSIPLGRIECRYASQNQSAQV